MSREVANELKRMRMLSIEDEYLKLSVRKKGWVYLMELRCDCEQNVELYERIVIDRTKKAITTIKGFDSERVKFDKYVAEFYVMSNWCIVLVRFANSITEEVFRVMEVVDGWYSIRFAGWCSDWLLELIYLASCL